MSERYPDGAWSGPAPDYDEDGNEILDILRPCYCPSCREYAKVLHGIGRLDVRYYASMVELEASS